MAVLPCSSLVLRPLALRLAAVLALSLATACSHVPLASMARLSGFQWEATDPGRLRVAIRHPEGIRVPEGGAVMVIEERRLADGSLIYREDFTFEQIREGRELAALAGERRPGETISVFRIAPEDAPRMRQVQARVRATSPQARALREGRLAVSVRGCRVGPSPAPGARQEPVRVTTYLAAEGLSGFVPLVRDFDLTAAMREATRAAEASGASRPSAPPDEVPPPGRVPVCPSPGAPSR